MSNLQLLIETTNQLSARLEESANNEMQFCIDIQMRLEQMSWEMLRAANDLQYIYENL